MRVYTLVLLGVVSLCGVVAFGQRGPLVRAEAPTDRAADFPLADLKATFAEMGANEISTVRLLEGGAYNVNIRHDANITPDTARIRSHPRTTDVWVVQEGSGTLVTGGEVVGDEHVGGVERVINVGDLIFIPAGVPHGMKETTSITWLNIRFPTK